jgi:hypothetical protein
MPLVPTRSIRKFRFLIDPTADTCVSAHVSRTTTQTLPVSNQPYASHLENMGKMIEDIEIELRSNLDAVTIPRHNKSCRDFDESRAGQV